MENASFVMLLFLEDGVKFKEEIWKLLDPETSSG